MANRPNEAEETLDGKNPDQIPDQPENQDAQPEKDKTTDGNV